MYGLNIHSNFMSLSEVRVKTGRQVKLKLSGAVVYWTDKVSNSVQCVIIEPC